MLDEIGTLDGEQVRVDGVDLHYLERGRGRPLIYLHGAGAMGAELFMSPLGRMLASRYRVLAFDRPGYGASSHDDRLTGPRAQARIFHHAFDRLGIERPVVIGHSWGGAAALALAVDHRDALAGIVSIAGWCYPTHETLVHLLSLTFSPIMGFLSTPLVPRGIAHHMVENMIQRVFAPNPVPPNFAHYPVERALRHTALRANAQDLRALNADMTVLAARYVELRMPVELIVGLSDRIVEPEHHALRLAEEIPGAVVTTLEGVGHMPHHIHPEAVVAAVDRIVAAT